MRDQGILKWIFLSLSFCACSSFAAAGDENWDAQFGVPGTDGSVLAMAWRGHEHYIGGYFSGVGGVDATNIARWDGTNWSSLGSGLGYFTGGSFQSGVQAIAFLGNYVYAGGNFTNAGSQQTDRIARWDGTNWSALGPGLDGWVRALVVDERGLVYAGGSFRHAGGSLAIKLALWDGANWSSLGGGVTQIDSGSADVVAMARNGLDIFIAGIEITEVGGVPAINIARWDGTRWSGLGDGVNYPGRTSTALALAANGFELGVGGYFSRAGSQSSTNIALWHIPHALSTSRSGNVLTLSWPATGTNFVLEATDSLPATNWSEVSQPPAIHDNQCVVTNQIDGSQKFYRLRHR